MDSVKSYRISFHNIKQRFPNISFKIWLLVTEHRFWGQTLQSLRDGKDPSPGLYGFSLTDGKNLKTKQKGRPGYGSLIIGVKHGSKSPRATKGRNCYFPRTTWDQGFRQKNAPKPPEPRPNRHGPCTSGKQYLSMTLQDQS